MKMERSYKLFDLVIKNGRLVDGTGNPWRKGDLGIKDGIITDIGTIDSMEAKEKWDAKGHYVCPGFIDAHSHTDTTVEDNPYFESSLRQGITTEVVGNCGNTVGLDATKSLGQHMAKLERKGMSANVAFLAGHNAIRLACGVTGTEYTEAQYQTMESCLRRSLDEGAIGMSSGLEFDPGRMSRPEELFRLARILSEYDAIYTSHIRNRDAKVWAALEEFLHIIEAFGIRGEVSHMNIRHNTHAPEGALGGCIERIKAIRDKGFDVLTDMTPLVYGTGSPAGILPPWLTQESPARQREMLLDKDTRALIRDDCDRYWRFIVGNEWDRVILQTNEAFPEINGWGFLQIAESWHKSPWDCYFDIMAEHTGRYQKIKFVARLFTDSHLVETISNPLYMLVVDGCSTLAEGSLAERTPFPLHYIGMAWFLTHHVREKKTLCLEEAVRKMTSMPAQHFRLGKRGLLAKNHVADIAIFDLSRLETPFNMENPCQYTKGMDLVLVSGQKVIVNDEHLHTTVGQCLRRGKC